MKVYGQNDQYYFLFYVKFVIKGKRGLYRGNVITPEKSAKIGAITFYPARIR